MSVNVDMLQQVLREFAKERDWEQFHTPKNLAMAIGGEAGELLDIFQWLTEEQSNNLDEKLMQHVEEELADIFLYILRMYDILNIDIEKTVMKKINKNKEKYPIEIAKGNAEKYNRRS